MTAHPIPEDAPRARRLPRRALTAVVAAAAVAAPLAVAEPAAAAGPQVVCTSGKAGLAAKLTKDITAALRGRAGHTGIAFDDPATKTSCTYDADRQFDSASVFKPIVLGTLLWDADRAKRSLTSREKSLAHKMITESDNDSTTELRNRLTTAKITSFVKAAGMKRTLPNQTWGTTQITARDEQRLLALFTSRNKLITDKSRAYALDLMNKVISSQRWGTPAGAPKGTKVHVKNGWLQRDRDHLWRVHSIGAFTVGGRTYTMSVLTHGNRTWQGGIDAIQAVARAVHRDVNPAANHAQLIAPPAHPQEVMPPGV
ncbi:MULTISPECIES: serine hydrolase [Streptomyces]|uniref:serine hydrolase n=1 Tax=Streptomyces TaxID=1883 RepID=UPI00163CA87E|nr:MULTISPECIES: serine hydrolase [Streptomyces]MBC2874599.1 serine hydrolase [Streptomyces sp. TYQ1024]UBI36636.1 class A beta-lactamase-related serine hydrolase [Streptomyces mobaraensis]UKW29228.1 class A beta-lactamase-related serine hydrolase [Streptomyces sp. TYQ1024]